MDSQNRSPKLCSHIGLRRSTNIIPLLAFVLPVGAAISLSVLSSSGSSNPNVPTKPLTMARSTTNVNLHSQSTGSAGDNSSTNSDSQVSSGTSLNMVVNSHSQPTTSQSSTSLNVNGQNIPVPPNGSFSQTTTSPDGSKTTINISSTNSSNNGSVNSSTNLSVDSYSSSNTSVMSNPDP